MNNIVYAGADAHKAESLANSKKYWQIILCKSSGTVTHGKGNCPYHDGDILVIPPLTSFQRAAAEGEIYTFLELATLPFKAPAAVKDDDNRGISHAVTQAACYFNRGADAVINALGDLIVSYIITNAQSTGYSPVVELVRADINANISNSSYALDGYIRSLPLNYDYVRKLFKNETGVTPHDYLTAARMDLAGMLITSGMSNTYSRYSVGQIAEMCGYAEPLYFSRVFKKYYGVSPSEYGKTKLTP